MLNPDIVQKLNKAIGGDVIEAGFLLEDAKREIVRLRSVLENEKSGGLRRQTAALSQAQEFRNLYEKAERANVDLEARLIEALAVLQPFARFGAVLHSLDLDPSEELISVGEHDTPKRMTVADFLAAREFHRMHRQ